MCAESVPVGHRIEGGALNPDGCPLRLQSCERVGARSLGPVPRVPAGVRDPSRWVNRSTTHRRGSSRWPGSAGWARCSRSTSWGGFPSSMTQTACWPGGTVGSTTAWTSTFSSPTVLSPEIRPMPAAARPAVRARAHTGVPTCAASRDSSRVPGRHERSACWISVPAGPLLRGTPASTDLDVPLASSLDSLQDNPIGSLSEIFGTPQILGSWVFAGRGVGGLWLGDRRWSVLATVGWPRTAQGWPGLRPEK
ncbi:hypothetical protein SHIRM173S_01634 [Streptomyces hirsutus]